MNGSHRGKRQRSRRWWRAWAVSAAVLLTAATAEAQITDGVPGRPTAPRLIDVVTAHKPFAHAALGLSHRGDLLATLELTLGEIAAAGLGYDDRLLVGATADDAEVQGRLSEWFRMNVPAGHWWRWQPALDLTFQRTEARADEDSDARGGQARAAELRATATKSWRSSAFGVIDLTAGLGLWEIAGPDVRLSDQAIGARVRPFGGVAWTPPSYPRTSLLLEGSFGPTVLDGQPRLDWRLGWGARYQVFSWSTIDLVVRNREDAGLAGSTVMVRLTAVLD